VAGVTRLGVAAAVERRQLCHDITLPALANELAHCNASGQVVLKLKTQFQRRLTCTQGRSSPRHRGATAQRTWCCPRWSSCNGWLRWFHARAGLPWDVRLMSGASGYFAATNSVQQVSLINIIASLATNSESCLL
jgi:hypothetical protein